MNAHILAVDDDPMIHKMLEFSLRNTDYVLETVNDAEGALNWLTKNGKEVGAIILDWQLPGMSGMDLLKWMKDHERYHRIPVIMLTSNDKKEDIRKGIDAGAYYYLVKPFNKELLLSILKAAVTDYLLIKDLSQKVQRTENPFGNMQEGKFFIRTLEEAEKLAILIANACPKPDEALIICELLNNAIEHGNLGITYDEKSKLIEKNSLYEEVMRRIESEEYADLFARVEFMREEDKLRVVIEDMGEGFDYERYLEFDAERVFDNHGRGIAMANSVLDIQYHGRGNKVEVRIPLHTQPAETQQTVNELA